MAFSGTDQIFGAPTTWALGYATGHPGADPQAPPTAFGWGGMGGSHAFADPASGIAFALTKNRLTDGFSTVEQLAGLVTKAVAALLAGVVDGGTPIRERTVDRAQAAHDRGIAQHVGRVDELVNRSQVWW